MARISERLGLLDPDKLKNQDAVFDSAAQMLKTAIDGKPKKPKRSSSGTGEPCSVADSDCIAPAGWDHGGYAQDNEEADAEFECSVCSNPVCGACSKEVDVTGSKPKRRVRLCNDCLEEA